MKSTLYHLLFVLLALVALLFTNSCQHCNDPTDPDCGNYDPCYGVSNNADFECAEYFDENTDLLALSDTLITGYNSWFRSKHTYDSYDWVIGSDTNHRTTKSFTIYFSKVHGTIPVTLIGKRQVNSKCIPHDDGVDTFTKNITIVDYKASPIMGRYTGSLISNLVDTFTIEIKANHGIPQISQSDPVLINLFRDCDVIFPIGTIGYKQFRVSSGQWYSPSGLCNKRPEIRGRLDNSNEFITITYTSSFDWNTMTNHTLTFIGKRIR